MPTQASSETPPDINGYSGWTPLATGGMGKVYSAVWDTDGTPVAVKVLHPSCEDPVYLKRFHDEYKALAAVHHANVVEVRRYIEGPPPCIVMELLHGETLKAAIARTAGRHSRFTSEDAIDVILGVLEGLGAAHKAGVIHRDVAPSNIFLPNPPKAPAGPQNQTRHARASVRSIIMDFGIGHSRDRDTALTRPTQELGHAVYAAPQQVLHPDHEPNASYDTFSCGVILHELLTGSCPCPDDWSERRSDATANRDYKPAKVVPAALQQVLKRALSFRPEDRFVTADSMSVALAEARRRLPSEDWRVLWPFVVGGLAMTLLALLAVAVSNLGGIPWLGGVMTRTPSPTSPIGLSSLLQQAVVILAVSAFGPLGHRWDRTKPVLDPGVATACFAQFRRGFTVVWLGWAGLYVWLFGFDLVRMYWTGVDERFKWVVADLLNITSPAALFWCFFVLHRPSVARSGDLDRPARFRRELRTTLVAVGLPVLALSQFARVVDWDGDSRLVSLYPAAIFAGMSVAALAARLNDPVIDVPTIWLLLLVVYAEIQMVYPLFDRVVDWVIQLFLTAALAFKLFLLLVVDGSIRFERESSKGSPSEAELPKGLAAYLNEGARLESSER